MTKEMTRKEQDRAVQGEAQRMQPERTRNEVLMPAADIYERGDDIHVVLDLPGCDPQAVDVQLEDGVLTVTAPSAESAPENLELLHEEYRPWTYQRVFQVSEAVKQEAIQARFRHGVLSLTLPKAEALKPRKIAITAEE